MQPDQSLVLHWQVFNVKEMYWQTTAFLTSEGHAWMVSLDQAWAGGMKPNLVSALIQRGALR